MLFQPPSGGKFAPATVKIVFDWAAGAPIELGKDARGVVTHVIVRTVEGDQKAVRTSATVPAQPR